VGKNTSATGEHMKKTSRNVILKGIQNAARMTREIIKNEGITIKV